MNEQQQPPLIEAHSQETQAPHHVRVLRIILVVFVVLIAVIVLVWWFVYRYSSPATITPPLLPVDGSGEQNELMIPIIEDTKNDKDKDGIVDIEEQTMGTSDTDFDTDGDGLSDKAEIDFWKTNPTNPDSDGDGFNDGVEVFNGYNPAGEGTI